MKHNWSTKYNGSKLNGSDSQEILSLSHASVHVDEATWLAVTRFLNSYDLFRGKNAEAKMGTIKTLMMNGTAISICLLCPIQLPQV